MAGFLGDAYLWVKAAHIIFAIFWMAGLFMLPRCFVYHQETQIGSTEDKRWVEREDRLRRIIIAPSMAIVWLLGIALALNTGVHSEGWFHAKFLIVFLLSGYTGWLAGYARKLAAGQRGMSDKALRIVNEVPGIAVALIVILVIVRPF